MLSDDGILPPTVHELVRQAEVGSPDETPEVIAHRLARQMSVTQRMSLVVRTLASEIEFLRRSRAREVERQAVLAKERAEVVAQQERDRAAWAALQPERESADQEKRAYWERYPMRAPKSTRIYREWARSDSGREYLRREAAEEAAREAELQAAGGYWGLLRKQVDEALTEARQEGRLELTRELLGSSFALGDGRSVTWGEATEAEHQQRMSLLGRQAAGTIETMTIHETAVQMLRASNARCLNEIAGVAA